MNLVSQQIAQISNPQFLSPLQTASEFFQFIISHLLQIALVIGVLGFITYLIIGGINYITSSGNRASLEDARRKISQALVGLIVLFSVFFIIQFANIAFGLNIGNLGFGYWPGWTPPGYSSPTPVPPASRGSIRIRSGAA